jgi:serine protease
MRGFMLRLSRIHSTRRVPSAIAVLVALVGAWASSSSRGEASAQGGPPPPHRLKLDAQRIAAFAEAASRRLSYLPGEVVIRFRPGVTPTGQQRALLSLRSRPSVSSLRWSGTLAVLSDASEPDSHLLADRLRRQPEVAFAEPNYLYRPGAEPNDPGFANLQWNFSTLDLPRAWDINPGGSPDLIVAIVDTGVTTVRQTFTFPTWNGQAIESVAVPFDTNPDLSAARLVSPYDAVFWDGPVLDMEGHGTHVSSTVGEDTNNALAEAGIAYRVRIMPVKACLGFWDIQFAGAMLGLPGSPSPSAGGCPLDALVESVRYAVDNGAKVINLSLGGFEPADVLREAVLYAVARGAFVAIAGGNAYEDGDPIEYPAAYSEDIAGAMAVGAVGRSRSRAFYSGTASGIEIAAPGGDHRQDGLAGVIWQSAAMASDSEPGVVLFPRFDRYVDTPSQGTSMAAPHVAGLAALIVSQGVSSPAAVEALIKATALDLGAAGADAEYGHGLIQPRLALRGYGLAKGPRP